MAKPKTVVITGAGFSKAAGGPLLRELLSDDAIDRSRGDVDTLYALARHVLARANSVAPYTVEDLFTDVWKEAATGGTIWLDGGDEYRAEDVWREVVIHLSSVCGAIRLREAGPLWNTYLDFFEAVEVKSRHLTYVTFNYDMLLEQCLDGADTTFNYGPLSYFEFFDANRKRRLRRRGADVSVLKLHGSANWGFCPGCDKSDDTEGLLIGFEGAYVPTRRRTCPYCDERPLESGIIAPILGKASEARKFPGLWSEARKSLRTAERVLVIGYSLPPGDHEAVSLMREIPSHVPVEFVCGAGGASQSFTSVVNKIQDHRSTFEEFVPRLIA